MSKERIGFVLLVGLLFLALLVVRVSDNRRIDELQRQVAELSDKAKASEALPTLEQQVTCNKEAKAFFSEEDYSDYEQAEYYSHYNTAMKKCFVIVKTGKMIHGQFWASDRLYDAIEHKNYGTYRWLSDKVKKFWEVPPVECFVEMSKEGLKL